MKLTYNVHSVDPVSIQREVEVDGTTVSATMAGVSVQLTSSVGSIFLNLTEVQADGHTFVVGEDIEVTFGGND